MMAASAAASLLSAADAYKPKTFDHYQVIVDRLPFGPMASDFGVEDPQAAMQADQAASQAQAEQLKQQYGQKLVMCAVTVTPGGGVAIGFVDSMENPPKNYILGVGESANGFTLISADYDQEIATLEEDGGTFSLKLGKGLVESPAARPVPAVQQPAKVLSAAAVVAAYEPPPVPVASSPIGRMVRPSRDSRGPPIPEIPPAQQAQMNQIRDDLAKLRAEGGDTKSYMERLRERKKAEKDAKDAAEQAAREEMARLAAQISEDERVKREREMNLKLIEQGARPVSDITLTPEEERDLVEKGVLAQ